MDTFLLVLMLGALAFEIKCVVRGRSAEAVIWAIVVMVAAGMILFT